MTLGSAWSLLETPVVFAGAAVVLAIAALSMLTEYRRLFMQDPKAAMSAEVLMAIVSRSGGPGYFAAFLLAGAIMFFALGLYHFAEALPHLFGF
jgi:hypothetical protein